MEFIRDCLSRNMSLRDVATKYDITLDEVMDRFRRERSKFTDEEIEKVIEDAYYL